MKSSRRRVSGPVLRASSWLHLLELLFADSWNERIGRFRSPYAFRGQPGDGLDLASGLIKLAAGRDAAALEQHLLRNFRKYAHAEVGESSIWHWLALAQHRGLPTRLVDWTYSPLVALHFATANLARMHEDSSVWTVNFVEANRTLPMRLRRLLVNQRSDTATVEMLDTFRSLPAFDRLGRQPFVLFMEPPSLDPRIVNQFALFSLMPGADLRMDRWLHGAPSLARRIVVPASLKWEVRDKLDQLNINERVLFPGLDGLTRWLTRYYWQRERGPSASGRIAAAHVIAETGPRRRR